MKTKQTHIKAVLPGVPGGNAVNYDRSKEEHRRYVVIDKKTEREVVDCRVYMGRSSNASRVYASIWIDAVVKPEGWEYRSAGGTGWAGGGGYCKVSASVQEAIHSVGIQLFGTTYTRPGEKVDFKKRAYIGGVGESAVREALLAIAYACGCKDAICLGM